MSALPATEATIVLVGMMGAGKTSIGRRLAKRLGRSFVDADEGFVARYGRTIPEVFDAYGEAGFRSMEAELVASLLSVKEPLVVAAGGGAVTTAVTRHRLVASDSCVVYLAAPVEYLVRRAQARAHRPLLADADPAEVMGRLHADRDPLYRQVADVVVDVEVFGDTAAVAKRAVVDHLVTLFSRAPSSRSEEA